MKVVFFVVFGVIALVSISAYAYKKTSSLIVGNNFSSSYVCWASPTPKSLKKCNKSGKCIGYGVYAWHSDMKVAKDTAMQFCRKNYGYCHFDYCEKSE